MQRVIIIDDDIEDADVMKPPKPSGSLCGDVIIITDDPPPPTPDEDKTLK